jgi:hypothetical protein
MQMSRVEYSTRRGPDIQANVSAQVIAASHHERKLRGNVSPNQGYHDRQLRSRNLLAKLCGTLASRMS